MRSMFSMNKRKLFEEIYSQSFQKVFAYFSLCFGGEAAEDLTQTVFMKVWKSVSSSGFHPPGSSNAWVFRIAVNVKNDCLREKYASLPCVEMREDDRTEGDFEGVDQAIMVERAFSLLPLAEKELLLLKGNGLNSGEIGEIYHISPSAVRSRLSSARQHLKKRLEECGVWNTDA